MLHRSLLLCRPKFTSPVSIMLCLLFFMSLQCSALWAHEDDDEITHSTGRMLGKIVFPTSANDPEAQQAFVRGMLLLHLFEYEFAREEFIAAQVIEPEFAMAYWGEAMTHNHPIWDEQDLQAARLVLLNLGVTPEQRLGTTDDPKEQAFLAALEVLYGTGSKSERDLRYAQTMESMAAGFPDDHEVQLFYALSLFGVNAGIRDIPSYMMSTSIAQNVFSANPQHPGAAHYLIHGVDDPDHAVLGLTAARALYEMAPDAGHSLHMTSHIFLALGMWEDSVSANRNAVRVQNGMRLEQGLSPRHWGHYNFWLLYSLLQQGRQQEALELLTEAYQELQAENKAPEDRLLLEPDRTITGSVVQMWARYLIETRDFTNEIAEWNFKLGDAFDPNLTYSFIQGMRAVHEGQTAKAGQFQTQFRNLQSELGRMLRQKDEPAAGDQLYLQRLKVMEQELQAGIEFARGESAAAAQYGEQASSLEGEMPYSFGPPFVDWPSAELHGEMLLDARKYADAEKAFELQLKRTRLRAASLRGLQTALQKQGKDAAAAYAAERLARIWIGDEGTAANALPAELEEN